MFLGHYDFDIPRMAIQTIQTKKTKSQRKKYLGVVKANNQGNSPEFTISTERLSIPLIKHMPTYCPHKANIKVSVDC